MKIKVMPLGELRANCYIVETAKKNAAAFDIGGEPEKLLQYLKESNLTLKKIFLTHGHYDHIGGVYEVQKQTGAEVYVHSGDGMKIQSSSGSLAVNFGRIDFKKIENFTEISDGDVIALDELEFKVLHTPGHTSGSVCYICNDYIFTGDTLFRCSIGRTDLPDGDFGKMSLSLEKLKALKEDYIVYPGHEAESTLDFEKNNNPYLKGNLYDDYI